MEVRPISGNDDRETGEANMDHEPHGALNTQLEQRNEEANEYETPKDETDETDESTPSREKELDPWPTDQPARTARYNYAFEKSLSNLDAKLFYQRHKLETSQQEVDAVTSRARTWTGSSNTNPDFGGLSRAASTASRRSDHAYARREQSARSNVSPALAGRDGAANSSDLLSSDLNNFDAYGPRLGREMLDDASDASDSKVKKQGMGMGIEDEFTTLRVDSSNIVPEMRTICTSIKRVQGLRHKYVGLSLQGPNDNPKDGAGWVIYPPPPEPFWDDVKNRPRSLHSGTNSLANSKILPLDQNQSRSSLHTSTSSGGGETAHQVPPSPAKRPRKPGQDIGEDFEMSDLLPLPEEEGELTFKLDGNSVYQVYENPQTMELEKPIVKVPTLRDFYSDLEYVIEVSSDGPSKSFAFRELDILEGKFNLYYLVNEYEETAICKRVPHRDFYNVRKVDTHVHHSACMNQKHLLRFIKSKMKKSPDEVVMFRDGKHLTLKEVFESINLTAYDLSIDTLDMHVRHWIPVSDRSSSFY